MDTLGKGPADDVPSLGQSMRGDAEGKVAQGDDFLSEVFSRAHPVSFPSTHSSCIGSVVKGD